ncbi:MAG: DUF1573 domain-containing protein [candidate division Zixibacteria bacterium]|nr:DUF1573 domain-containing protein [candidate division Zixibacteria bacterium]
MIYRYFLSIILGIIIALSGAVSQADESPSAAEDSGARIAFDLEKWDFGYTPNRSMVVRSYFIKNTGDDTLRIEKVKPSCGCTSAPLAKDVLPPGDSTELVVGFKTQRFKGSVEKHIKITSNDPTNPTATIAFTAVVDEDHPSLKAEPNKVNFVQILEGDKAEREIELTNTTNSKMMLVPVDGPEGDIKFKLKDEKLDPGESTKIEIEIDKDAKPGLVEGSITMEVMASATARISIPIHAEVIPK